MGSLRFLTRAGASSVGEGRIDNIILDRSVHVYVGTAALSTLLVACVLVGRHAWRDEPIGRAAGWSLALAQAVLAVQVLVGIKLLDQGQGIVQLYIHYVGGLIPLGVFLVGAWFARGDTGRSARVLAGLMAVGLLSAAMAFFIGRAYANGAL